MKFGKKSFRISIQICESQTNWLYEEKINYKQIKHDDNCIFKVHSEYAFPFWFFNKKETRKYLI